MISSAPPPKPLQQMTVRFSFLISSVILSILFCASIRAQFSVHYGGLLSDYGRDIITVNDGYVALGYTNSFGGNSKDVWMIKTDFDGNELWSRTYGDENVNEGHALVQAEDGGFGIAGISEAPSFDFLIIKTDSFGIEQWSTSIGHPSEYEHAWGVDNDGNGGFWVCGVHNTSDLGSQLMLVHIDNEGQIIDQFEFGENATDQGYSLVSMDDGVIVAGRKYNGIDNDVWLVRINASGMILWEVLHDFDVDDTALSVIPTSDQGYFISGITGDSGGDYLGLKVDSVGSYQWHQSFGGGNIDWAYDAIELDDGFVICGKNSSMGSGQSDGVLVKYDFDGNEIWSSAFGGEMSDEFRAMTVSNYGCIAAIGNSRSYGGDDEDLWIVSTTCGGSLDGFGCTDPSACNYDIDAIEDNGGCQYALYPYDCVGNCLNDSDGDGLCDELEDNSADVFVAPFNPDADGDGYIDATDFLQFLAMFGTEFETPVCSPAE